MLGIRTMTSKTYWELQPQREKSLRSVIPASGSRIPASGSRIPSLGRRVPAQNENTISHEMSVLSNEVVVAQICGHDQSKNSDLSVFRFRVSRFSLLPSPSPSSSSPSPSLSSRHGNRYFQNFWLLHYLKANRERESRSKLSSSIQIEKEVETVEGTFLGLKICEQKRKYLVMYLVMNTRGRYSLVDLSAPPIIGLLRPWVWIPSTPSLLFHNLTDTIALSLNWEHNENSK